MFYSELFCRRSFFLYRSCLWSNFLLYSRFLFYNRSILGNNLYGYFYQYLLVEMNGCNIVTDGLDITHGDDLTVNIMTQFLQFFSNMSGIDRTISNSGCTYFGYDCECDIFQSLCLFLCLCLLCSELVSLLAQILGKHLLC